MSFESVVSIFINELNFAFIARLFRLDNILENDPANSTALEQAIKEATNDATFQKVKRMSYSGNAAGEVSIQHK